MADKLKCKQSREETLITATRTNVTHSPLPSTSLPILSTSFSSCRVHSLVTNDEQQTLVLKALEEEKLEHYVNNTDNQVNSKVSDSECVSVTREEMSLQGNAITVLESRELREEAKFNNFKEIELKRINTNQSNREFSDVNTTTCFSKISMSDQKTKTNVTNDSEKLANNINTNTNTGNENKQTTINKAILSFKDRQRQSCSFAAAKSKTLLHSPTAKSLTSSSLSCELSSSESLSPSSLAYSSPLLCIRKFKSPHSPSSNVDAADVTTCHVKDATSPSTIVTYPSSSSSLFCTTKKAWSNTEDNINTTKSNSNNNNINKEEKEKEIIVKIEDRTISSSNINNNNNCSTTLSSNSWRCCGCKSPHVPDERPTQSRSPRPFVPQTVLHCEHVEEEEEEEKKKKKKMEQEELQKQQEQERLNLPYQTSIDANAKCLQKIAFTSNANVTSPLQQASKTSEDNFNDSKYNNTMNKNDETLNTQHNDKNSKVHCLQHVINKRKERGKMLAKYNFGSKALLLSDTSNNNNNKSTSNICKSAKVNTDNEETSIDAMATSDHCYLHHYHSWYNTGDITNKKKSVHAHKSVNTEDDNKTNSNRNNNMKEYEYKTTNVSSVISSTSSQSPHSSPTTVTSPITLAYKNHYQHQVMFPSHPFAHKCNDNNNNNNINDNNHIDAKIKHYYNNSLKDGSPSVSHSCISLSPLPLLTNLQSMEETQHAHSNKITQNSPLLPHSLYCSPRVLTHVIKDIQSPTNNVYTDSTNTNITPTSPHNYNAANSKEAKDNNSKNSSNNNNNNEETIKVTSSDESRMSTLHSAYGHHLNSASTWLSPITTPKTETLTATAHTLRSPLRVHELAKWQMSMMNEESVERQQQQQQQEQQDHEHTSKYTSYEHVARCNNDSNNNNDKDAILPHIAVPVISHDKDSSTTTTTTTTTIATTHEHLPALSTCEEKLNKADALQERETEEIFDNEKNDNDMKQEEEQTPTLHKDSTIIIRKSDDEDEDEDIVEPMNIHRENSYSSPFPSNEYLCRHSSTTSAVSEFPVLSKSYKRVSSYSSLEHSLKGHHWPLHEEKGQRHRPLHSRHHIHRENNNNYNNNNNNNNKSNKKYIHIGNKNKKQKSNISQNTCGKANNDLDEAVQNEEVATLLSEKASCNKVSEVGEDMIAIDIFDNANNIKEFEDIGNNDNNNNANIPLESINVNDSALEEEKEESSIRAIATPAREETNNSNNKKLQINTALVSKDVILNSIGDVSNNNINKNNNNIILFENTERVLESEDSVNDSNCEVHGSDISRTSLS